MTKRSAIVDTEAALVGALVMRPQWFDVLPPTLAAAHFSDAAIAKAFTLAHDLHHRGEQVSGAIVAARLTIEEADTLADCTGSACSSAMQAEAAAKLVLSAGVKRWLADRLLALSLESCDATGGADEVLARVEEIHREADAVLSGSNADADWMDESAGMAAVLREVEDAQQGRRRGVTCGLSSLDLLTGGFRPTRTWVIGARPGEGKSTLAGQFALHVANKGGRALLLSLEMPADQIWQRIASNETGISGISMRDGKVSPSDFMRLTRAACEMQNRLAGRLKINSRCPREVNAVLSAIRTQHRKQPVAVVFVDFIQKIQVGRAINKNQNRNNELEIVSSALADLARQLQICVVIVSQLNRLAEGVKPTKANLRDCGAIEQDADVIVFLWRDDVNDITKRTLTVDKNRDGMPGDVEAYMDVTRMRFNERMP